MIRLHRWALCLAWFLPGLALACAAPAGTAIQPAATSAPADQALARAQSYVQKHPDKYLHHSKLRRGMKGYGLTVMAGTKIERFDAEIVSVMANWGPHQDVILAKLTGLGLEKSGIIAGMSGSPVYIQDADGKYKMIGAVAYGWPGPKEPLCGIQPITQMLAVNGVLEDGKKDADKPEVRRGEVSAIRQDAPRAATRLRKPAGKGYLQRYLNPAKIEFVEAGGRKGGGKIAGSTKMVALKTPLMVSGLNDRTVGAAEEQLAGSGVMLVQSGGAGTADAPEHRNTKLEPGSGIVIPLASGDAELSAVGTVTEVLGDRVLAFGHAFFAQGEIDVPMGPAYIHTVVSGVMDSFKLGSAIRSDPARSDSVAVGSLWRDESVGIAGRIGGKSSTIPMTVHVQHKGAGEDRTFRYNIVRHPMFTPLLVAMLTKDACMGWHDLPKEHTLRYQTEVDFGKLGKYAAANLSSDNGVRDLTSDLVRPISAMLNNPWSKPPPIESISVRVTIEPQTRTAELVELKLQGRVFRPGETIRGELTLDPFRQARQRMSVTFEVPADLPEGNYQLTVCNSTMRVRDMTMEMPQRFDPHSLEEMMASMARVAEPKTDQLYLCLQLPEGGLAVRQKELPDLPASKMQILSQDSKTEATAFSRSLVRAVQGEFVYNGTVGASFEVKKQPRETLTRDQRNTK